MRVGLMTNSKHEIKKAEFPDTLSSEVSNPAS